MTATRAPRRALIVSADIGEGHNSAGRALGEAIGRAWPGCEVGWLDALAAMNQGSAARPGLLRDPGTAPALDVRVLLLRDVAAPLVPGVEPGAGWEHDSAGGSRPRIRAFDPDVIVSTYPLGSAGLELAAPGGANSPRRPAPGWPPSARTPSWLYPNLDITHVMHPTAADIAAQAEPGIRVALLRHARPRRVRAG